MNNYFCPYCNPKYQFPKKDSYGNIYCGLCGDYMIKKTTLSIKKLVAFLLAFAFIMPLIYIFSFSFIKEFKIKQKENFQVYFSQSSKVFNL